ncbi:hypothetical protein JYJ95_17755 [Corallococcus exiguus]|uniref:hypothetical protein n=1 Tax=Corallococcus exiguus TaxID=83462 RepID=UPI001A8C258F|nr:hypothetical protein [Corallococcus exiguus]MBN8468366.1 hypothetical protein [Corallococcus exiguus]
MAGRTWLWGAVLVVWLAGCGAPPEENDLAPTPAEALEVQETDAVAAGAPGHDPRGRPYWVRPIRGADDDFPTGIEHDREGNVVTAGYSFPPVDFGTGPIGPANGLVGTLAKYRPDGTLVWAKLLVAPPPPGGGFGGVNISALHVDRVGNILVGGGQTGGLDLGSGPLPEGAFLAQLNRQGNLQWVKSFVGIITPRAITTDRAGNVAMAAYQQGTVDYGDGPVTVPPTSLDADVLVSYTPGLDLRWVYLEVSHGLLNDVSADAEGDFYLAGIGPDPVLPFTAMARFQRISSKGCRVWLRTIPGANSFGVRARVNGNRVITSGDVGNSFSFAGRPVVVFGTQGFVAAYTRAGEERWAGAIGNGTAYADIDHQNHVFATGRYTAGQPFGFGRGPLPGVTQDGGYLARIERSHGQLEQARMVATGPVTPMDLSVTEDGRAGIIGLFGGATDFGFATLDTVGKGDDVFVLQPRR